MKLVRTDVMNNDTWLMGFVVCSYDELVKAFGKENVSPSDTTSTEWALKDVETGECYRIYDYKATNVYDSDLPTVEYIRKLSSFEWHVGGGREDEAWIEPFKTFMTKRFGREVEVTHWSRWFPKTERGHK